MQHPWVDEHFLRPDARWPFTFVYNEQASSTLLTTWPRQHETCRLDTVRTQHVITWTDTATGLEVRCVAVEYADDPAIEWTVYFKNTGASDTPILRTIYAIDTPFLRTEDGEFTLHGIAGDWNAADCYEPFRVPLYAGTLKQFMPEGGRASNGAWPYYNVQWPGGGVLMAVGWPGQWKTIFVRDHQQSLQVVAGQQVTYLTLKPGEEVRTPLIALRFWQGDDVVHAQNQWRRWMCTHNLPRTAAGEVPGPMSAFCSGSYFPGLKVSEASEKQFIDVLVREGAAPDYWWMDAGWYPCNAWPDVGTWEPDPERFPHGIKAVSDYAHRFGMQTILWFEPERVTDGSWIAVNHPEWVLQGNPWLVGGQLLNLGNPEARAWLTDHVDALITEHGIDLYRQDFNMDPLLHWFGNDAPNRLGMTENLHIQGYLAFWDELRRRHPGMLIDSCASGGRRNDLETLRRAVPLLRSDFQAVDGKLSYATGNQGHTYGLSSWLPFYGHGVNQSPTHLAYFMRSHMSPCFGIGVDVRMADIDWEAYRRLMAQWRQLAPCMLGDYYPLTPYSLDPEQWIAWQFHRPGQGDGAVQAFRREKATVSTQVYRLAGLDPAAQYAVTNLDANDVVHATGDELMEQGLPITINEKPGSAVIIYRRINLG